MGRLGSLIYQICRGDRKIFGWVITSVGSSDRAMWDERSAYLLQTLSSTVREAFLLSLIYALQILIFDREGSVSREKRDGRSRLTSFPTDTEHTS